MATMLSVNRRFGGDICRRCLNEKYGLELSPRDCIYENPFPQACACCGEHRNIVTDLRPMGKLRLLSKRDP